MEPGSSFTNQPMFSFGNAAGNSGNSLFQSSTTNTGSQNSQPASTGFQFGQSNPATNTNTSSGTGFSFGAPATTSTPATTSSFNFGSSASASNPIGSYNSPGMNSSSTAPLVTSMASYPFQYIQQCFDPNHSNYRFRTFFYNLADDLSDTQRVERQTQKPVNVSDSLWAQVQNDNPNPSVMVPVLANGFGDLHARATHQDTSIRAHTEKLTELHGKSSDLLRDLDIDLTAKLIAAQQRHQALSLRLLKIMKGMEILRRSGTKLSASESQALTKLKASLSKLLNGPLEGGSLHNLNFQLDSLLESGRLDAFRSAKAIKPANEEAAIALHSLLEDQQENLKSIVESIQKDSVDLQTIKAGYRPL